MNYRYLFKAKRIDNGEWIVGSLLTIAEINSFICTGKIELDGALKGHICPEMYAVDKSTLCQCTGLKDKNGTLIWENDVVFVTGYSYIEPEFELCGRVTWPLGDSCFEIDGDPIVESKGSYLTEYHVLGNYFDNPELLEVE